MRALAPLALLAGLGGMSLGGCSTMMVPAAGDLTPEAAPAYVAMAASSDMYEIESSRLALQRTRVPMHRMHAEMMIRDHTNTTNQLKAAAATAGLGVPMTMLPMHQAMLADLSRATDFDGVYHQQQVLSHEQALALHGNYAQRGDNPALRGVAFAAVPVVRGHLDHLRRM